MSVGRSLFLLVATQTAIAFLLVLVAVRTMEKVQSDYRHMYEYQFKSIGAIGYAMAEAEALKPGEVSPALESFYWRYRKDWEAATGATDDAIRFRKDLEKAGATDLLRREADIITNLKQALDARNTENIRKNLAALHDLDNRYADLANHYETQRLRTGRRWILSIGIVGTVVILLIGLLVRRAIAPRIQRLVTGIRKFRQTGHYERIADTGTDDIAALANALDAGVSAIASRERDQAEFLSIAAHELKTPVTTIHGYAALLATQTSTDLDVDRAVKTIYRQSWRLSRLIDALFLAMKARSRRLDFEPRPFDMSVLVQRVLVDMEPLLWRKTFQPRIDSNISILGDEALLEHALWSLFTCASVYSAENVSMQVVFSAVEHRVRLTVVIVNGKVSKPEIEELFMPFRFVEYETGSGVRSAVGLYLCREIVRLHNGTLRVEEHSRNRPEFVMELAR
jgi:signal transduction histidine kinase